MDGTLLAGGIYLSARIKTDVDGIQSVEWDLHFLERLVI